MDHRTFVDDRALTVISFVPLEIESSRVRVAWSVEPASPFYKRNSFTLEFGDALDARTLPLKLWWAVALLNLHAHWNLLRPCRVILPIILPDAEIEFWLRLLDAERVSLEAYRGTRDFARTIEIVGAGPQPEFKKIRAPEARYATAFSGGKESLLQTALLAELSTRPLLVNTQSEMPPMQDHSNHRRANALREIVRRRDCELVVVQSDIRSGWTNEYSYELGYRRNINEVCDAFVYIANLFAVAYARGVRTFCLGAEREGQRGGMLYDDKPAQFYFMMSAPILLALAEYFQMFGMQFYSLLWGLSHYLDEKILWQRYPDLADLQNSCWGGTAPEIGYCSKCLKCLKIAMLLIGMDIDPARLEIDVTKMFLEGDKWGSSGPPTAGALAFAARQINLARARRFFPPENFIQRVGWQEPRAFRAFKTQVDELRGQEETWVGQYHAAFDKYLPPALRDSLHKIFCAYAPIRGEPDTASEIALTDSTAAWITAPLDTLR